MPFWQKTGAKITPAKKVPSMSSSMTSLSPSQLNAAIMDMLNVNNTGNQCINACRGKTGWYLDINCCEMYRRHNDCPQMVGTISVYLSTVQHFSQENHKWYPHKTVFKHLLIGLTFHIGLCLMTLVLDNGCPVIRLHHL